VTGAGPAPAPPAGPLPTGPRWLAVVSDIHGNWHALQAVLQDMAAYAPEAILNLGDTVGYGPAPRECVQWARENCRVCLLGNHDAAAVGLLELEWFNPAARHALEWTARQLSTDERLWLAARPVVHRIEQPGWLRLLLVHGTPREPVTEYVEPEVALAILRRPDFDICLVGHTHLMGVYTRVGYRPLLSNAELQLSPPCLVNVGSVGQPRDGQPQAGYVLVDPATGRLVARRVPYDVEATQRAMLKAGLPRMLAERLRLGQ